MKCGCLKKLIIQDATTTHDIPLDLQGLNHNTTWKWTSLLTLLLSPLFWQQAMQHPHICFPVPVLSHWKGIVKYFFLWNILLYNRLALDKKVTCSPIPKPSNNSYKCNLHTWAIQNGHFFLIDREPLLKALLEAHESLFCITILQLMIVWWQKKTLLTTILDYIFLYMLWKIKVFYIFLEDRLCQIGVPLYNTLLKVQILISSVLITEWLCLYCVWTSPEISETKKKYRLHLL